MNFVVPLTIGAVGSYLYSKGTVPPLLSSWINKQLDENSRTNQPQFYQPPQQPQVVVFHEQPKAKTLYLTGGIALLILAGYYYYTNVSSTTHIVSKVEETAEQTQDLVEQCDENNAKRFELLDEKNDKRADNLELNLRSEQNARFEVLTNLATVTNDVAIRILKVITGNQEVNEEETRQFAADAQRRTNEAKDSQKVSNLINQKRDEIGQEIQSKYNNQNNVLNTDYNDTPGEFDKDDISNSKRFEIWRMKQQKPCIIDADDNNNNNNNNNNDNDDDNNNYNNHNFNHKRKRSNNNNNNNNKNDNKDDENSYLSFLYRMKSYSTIFFFNNHIFSVIKDKKRAAFLTALSLTSAYLLSVYFSKPKLNPTLHMKPAPKPKTLVQHLTQL